MIKKEIWFIISMLILVVFIMGCTSTNSAEYTVGNSTFSVPKEYEISSTGELTMPYGNLTNLNSTENGISVVEYINKEKWNEEISSFRIPDKTIRGELLYKEQDKIINGTAIIRFEDTGMPFKYYFFEKNGKYYSIDIYLPDNSNIHDELATMIISTLKNKSDIPKLPFIQS